jgi:flagellar basal body-associated protein FliL
VLTCIIIVLILIILGGTLYALIRGPVAAGASGSSAAGSASGETNFPAGIAIFTGIGRLRIPVGGGAVNTGFPRTTIVLSIVFPYPVEDRLFTEELAGKIPLFRRIAQDYFGVLSFDELSPLDEDKAKAELLGRFNRELRLGSIDVLFFNDLLILE